MLNSFWQHSGMIGMHTIIVAAGLLAFFLSFISIPSIVIVARKKNLTDEPGGRRVHKNTVPNLGGVAVFAGFTLSFLIFANFYAFPQFQYLLAGAFVLFFIGIKDDIMIIAPLTKFLGQLVATLVVVLPGGLYLTHLHGFFGLETISPWLGAPLTVFVLLVIINAFNLIDGIDGLSSGIGILSAATFGTWFFLTQHYAWALVAFALVGALLAFFYFNVFGNENKVFLGDTGALILGLIVGVLTIQFNEFNIDKSMPYWVQSAPSVSFGVLVIPLVDTLRVMFIRSIISDSLFKADKNHLHHQLLALGFSHKRATFTILFTNLLFILFVFFVCQFMSIRRLLLLILVIAMFLNYVPAYFIDRKKNHSH